MEWNFFSLFHGEYTSKNFDDNKVATLHVKPGKINEICNVIKLHPSVSKRFADYC